MHAGSENDLVHVERRKPGFDDRIELHEIWDALVQGKWIVIGITFIVTGAALVYSLLQPNVYEAEVLLAPSTDEDSEGLAGLAGQLGGLASLAGINLGGSATDKTTLALEVLQSRGFIHDFVRRREILPYLLAAKSWNQKSGQWIIDAELYDVESATWVRAVDPPKTPEPSSWELSKFFRREVLGVSTDDETGMVRVSIRSLSPLAAQQWVTWLIADLNEHMRLMDISDAQKSIRYLNEQIAKTSVAEMHNVFYGLIEQQTRTMMLASVRDDYVFKTVDPALAPEEKASPKRALICALGLVVGLMFGGVFVLVRRISKSPGV
jgi:LPS O-antigen subunit length determinant protein (WzzB/FepE family)